MSQQAHYFKIGVFVLGATALAVVGIIVLGAGKWFERSTTVETYFYESVQGLEIGAPVRLRGVRVGRVESIQLAREEYGLFFDPKTDSFPYRGLVLVRRDMNLQQGAVTRAHGGFLELRRHHLAQALEA